MRARLILIEGADCAGKSSLASALAERLGWKQEFLGHQPGQQYARYREAYSRAQLILDRGHYSELVYSQLFGRERPFTPAQQAELQQSLAGEAILIWARPSDSLALARWQAKESAGPPQNTRAHQLLHAHRMFDRLREESGAPVTHHYQSQDWAELERLLARIQAELSP